MVGLVPATHADAKGSILQASPLPGRVDGRDKPGQDERVMAEDYLNFGSTALAPATPGVRAMFITIASRA